MGKKELSEETVEPELTEAEIQKFKMLAAQVQDDRHFAAILNTVSYDRRRPLYEQITPHLAFKAKPFILYKFH